MKTPMQEMLEWVRATLPMDLDWPMLIEEKVQSLLQKEKEVMCEFAYKCHKRHKVYGDFMIQDYYNETFNSKEK